MDLLVEHAAEARGIESKATFLGAIVRVEMELAGGVTVHMAVEARDAQAWIFVLAIVGGIELFLRKRRDEQSQAVELHGGDQLLKQPVEVVDRDDLAIGNVAELRAVLQEDGRRELGQERLGEIVLDVESLQPREHPRLRLRKD